LSLPDIVNVLRVDHHWNAQIAGRPASIEQGPDLVCMEDVRPQSPEDGRNLGPGSKLESRRFPNAHKLRPESLYLGGQCARPLNAEHRNAVPAPPPVANQVDHDPLKPAGV
jgi:hypothetical protein